MEDRVEIPPRPILAESSTSESTTVDVAMRDLEDKTLLIPDYQRDADQWSDEAKSLLIESVINNLTIPAFFFEVQVGDDGLERNYVVDGQQRLTTLQQFWRNDLQLVAAEDASYLSPQSVHYAGKILKNLPAPYQQAFKKYRLTVIKLRDLGALRLETFRRINQGGEPLSGQDIRLAYYGDGSPSVTLLRLIGVYDPGRVGAKRFVTSAKQRFGIDLPWSPNQFDSWIDWWKEKDLAKGQTPSEMFLWMLLSAHVVQLEQLLSNKNALATLRFSYDRSVASAMDAFCAQLQYQDRNPESEPLLPTAAQLQTDFFPFFQQWFHELIHRGPSLSVRQYRFVAAVIGAAHRLQLLPQKVSSDGWGRIIEFIRSPAKAAQSVGVSVPISKGRWDGAKGYRAQLESVKSAVEKVAFPT